jgi:putative phosphoesterase
MKIGIFSDVHDNIDNLKKAQKVFEENGIEMAIFCGDLVSPFTLKFLSEWKWEVKAVFGNNEGDKWGFARRFNKYDLSNIEYPKSGIFWEFEKEGKRFGVFHGNSEEVVKIMIEGAKYDVVCTGHDHEPKIKKINNLLWINPGSVTGISENPDIKNGTVAIYDSEKNEALFFELK